jgi:two-component system, LytTR family, response regulator
MSSTILLQGPAGTEVVRLNDILWCRAEGTWCRIRLTGNREFMENRNLKSLSGKLCHTPAFMRVHRMWLVNRQHIKTFSSRKNELTMQDGKTIKVARRKKGVFVTAMGNAGGR